LLVVVVVVVPKDKKEKKGPARWDATGPTGTGE
jgi:hypothetical protein